LSTCKMWNVCFLTSKAQLAQLYAVFTRSSKRPANFQQMYSKYTC